MCTELIIGILGVSVEAVFKENVSMGSNLGDLPARSLSFDRLGICGFKRGNDGIIWMMFADTPNQSQPSLPSLSCTIKEGK